MTCRITQSQRLEHIRQLLLTKHEVSAESLAESFGVSHMTVHRDLEKLENKGEIIRTYGGAAPAKKLTFEFSFQDKLKKNRKKKEYIARKAMNYVDPGQSIILDTGTTTLKIAEQLAGTRDITVITTSLAIVSLLQFAEGIEVILLGGYLRKGSPDLHGPLTEMNIDFLRADIAFMGADAIDDKGNIYTSDMRVVRTDRLMAQNADKVIIVADSSKFGNNEMCQVLKKNDYDFILTDKPLKKIKKARHK
jgi:DeoR/GlpR family transcriptional regulator of sugar metabolism